MTTISTVKRHEKKFMRGAIFLFSLVSAVESINSSVDSDTLSPEADTLDSGINDDPESSDTMDSGETQKNLVTSSEESDGQSSAEGGHGSEVPLKKHENHSPTISDSHLASTLQSTEVGHSTDANGDQHPLAALERDDFTGADEKAGIDDDSSGSEDSEPRDPSAGIVKQLLNHLFGEAIDSFSTSDSLSKIHGTMTIDCTSPAEDGDANFTIVTTLCPFVRAQGPCGRLRHPTYEIEDEEAICSAQCRPHINDLIRALPNRQSLSHKYEGVIFRDVVNEILRQYCSICRTGCIL